MIPATGETAADGRSGSMRSGGLAMGVANGGPETGATTTTSAPPLTAGRPKPGLRPSLDLPPHTRLAMSLANAGCNSSMTMAGSLIAVRRSVPCGLAGCQPAYSDVTGNAPTRRCRERFFLETPHIASILIISGTGWERRLAEGVGFEPTRDLATPGGFQDRCLKPLGHPSKPLVLLGLFVDPR